uniref:PSII 6.1 kDa protein n=1 Tax=Gymnochlora stellata TaxID=67809 RepID=B5A4J5_GYMST|nr:photosystem II reaction center W protein [Gymnochlora stellata]
MSRKAFLIGSIALNALLVVVLCSSLLSQNSVGAGVAVRNAPATRMMARQGRTAVYAKKGLNTESLKNFQRNMAAVGLSATAALHQLPAEALVDARLNGDGAGIPLGINDSRLFFILAGVFTLVWAAYSTSVKGISNNDDDDSGLSID